MEKIINKILSPFGYKIVKNPFYNKEKWEKEIISEIMFWDEWCRTGGSKWKDRFIMKRDPNSQLQSFLLPYIDKNQKKTKILDVGSGPLTEINKKCELTELEIFPVDPLAQQYEELLKKYNIEPLVKVEPAYGEKLTDTLPENFFDIVYSRNAVDHSYNPLKFIEEMIKTARKNHFVFLRFFENEATFQNWSGFHKWNFFIKKNIFGKDVLWLQSRHFRKVNVAKKFKRVAELVELSKENRQITAVFKKL